MNAHRGKPRKRQLAASALGYHERRELEQMKVHGRVIDRFIAQYKKAPPSPNRQTLFFFPGGMACQLKRARFKDGDANPTLKWEKMWLRLSSFLWRARRLGMARESEHLFRDRGDYLVIADGAVNLNGCTPHDALKEWCADNDVAFFEFNWDWRRRQEDTARLFVEQFWPEFKRRVEAAGIPQAAQNFSLLGHSFGGMLVNLILRDSKSEVAQKLRFAITAATPFYGYAGQAHRWFEGETLLNGDGKGEWIEIVQVINSMPGLYVLHYLDLDTYKDAGPALAADREFPLATYPNIDAGTGKALDPWSQEDDGKGQVRYPEKCMGFDTTELAHARKVFRCMSSKLEDERFYNIRGVTLGRDGQPLSNTVGSAVCGWIPPDFLPTQHDCPITNGGKVPGDNTQPAWTARLVRKEWQRFCKTVRGTDLGHMFLMNDPGTLKALAEILFGPHAAPSVIKPRPAPQFASQNEFDEFSAWLRSYADQRSVRQPSDKEIWDEMPPKMKKSFPAIATRIIEEILKRPDAMH